MKSDFLDGRNYLEECPQCGKHSLARHGEDKYHCLWCGFYRDISAQPSGGGRGVIVAIILAFLLVALANQTRPPSHTSNSLYSSSVPSGKILPNKVLHPTRHR